VHTSFINDIQILKHYKTEEHVRSYLAVRVRRILILMEKLKIIALIFLIFGISNAQFLFKSTQPKDSELIKVGSNLILTQACSITIVCQHFVESSLSDRLVQLVEDSFTPVTIASELAGMAERELATCHLHVVVTPSEQFMEKLDFNNKEILHVLNYSHINIKMKKYESFSAQIIHFFRVAFFS
jgi:hypothetical protein